MPTLAELLDPRRVSLALKAKDKQGVLAELADLLVDEGEDPASIVEVLWAREQLASTGVGSGVAIPHGRLSGLSSIRAALGVHPEGVAFDAIDGERVHVFVAILAPEDRPSQHLKLLAQVSRLLRRKEVRERLRAATDYGAVVACLTG